MLKKTLIALAGVLLIFVAVFAANSGQSPRVLLIDNSVQMSPPAQRLACQLSNFNGTAVGAVYYTSGVRTAQYFDPADCGALPIYPFEIQSVDFSLYDYDGTEDWPILLDFVVYDVDDQNPECTQVGTEKCRITVTCDSLTFCYPAGGTAYFASPCCVNGPFFLAVEYTDPRSGVFPSIIFDDQLPDTCDMWFGDAAGWVEWYPYWGDPPPIGYPMWWVNGETDSPNCVQSECSWNPGDPHKMHFPQLPDEAGWDVNATEPVVLADDFLCTETGWIKDIHFWGSWKHGIEGEILYFLLSFHSDIPAQWVCYDTTWATGDCDGDGTVLTVADYAYLVNYLAGGPAPVPLWIADMNGDCVVDQADADLYNDYFTYGLSVFDPYGGYPVSACCDSVLDYSRPGETLWEMDVTEFEITPKDPPSMEGWYDPSTGEVIYDDHQAYFQYDICLDSLEWFWQEEGNIYWLNISAVVADPHETQWGWKSTLDHWNDDAVWAWWGELAWVDMWEPSVPITNLWWVALDQTGMLIPPMSGGTDFFGNGWYYYEETNWWNIWFYDHPFDENRRKEVRIEFYLDYLEPLDSSLLVLAVNWSTDLWSLEQPPGDSTPPLPWMYPPGDEELYIGRDTLYAAPVDPGHYVFKWILPDYNPEWVSIDVSGYNFMILEGSGVIEHECQGSLDLSFVITNTGLVHPLDSGACCDTFGVCYISDQLACVSIGHHYQGDFTTCTPNPCDSCDFQDPGDLNSDGMKNVTDWTYLINYLYRGGSAPVVAANADVNGDCCVDWRDVKYYMDYLFSGGPAPVNCTCIHPPICVDTPLPHTDGRVMHNLDGWNPPDGSPVGTNWHELNPTYCTNWTLNQWWDNGDGILSFCDTVEFINATDPTDTIIEHIELVTTTLLLVNLDVPNDTMYVDLINPPNPLNNPITDPWGSQWHEVHPDYCRKWQLVFWSGFMVPPLAAGNTVYMQSLNGPDSTLAWDYGILSIETDIVTGSLGCCIPPIRGNVNYDPADAVNIADLTFLVAYLFGGGGTPPCLPEANVNGDPAEAINIADLTYLVAYLFGGGPAPAPCP